MSLLQDFAHLEVSGQELRIISRVNSGWMKLYTYTQKLEDNEKSLTLLAKILAVEMNSPPSRHIILTRIHMRYCAMRQRLEFDKLMKKIKEQK